MLSCEGQFQGFSRYFQPFPLFGLRKLLEILRQDLTVKMFLVQWGWVHFKPKQLSMGGVYKDILYSLSTDPLFCLEFVKVTSRVLSTRDMNKLNARDGAGERQKTKL